jgi:cell filamentation protein
MARAESQAILSAQERLVDRFSPDHRFVADDVRSIHRAWLGSIYSWAGEYRGLNLGKGGFQFAAATEVPRLMREFEQRELARYTPCRFTAELEIARALSVVHAELVLIHPFREGNGRCARLLALLMAFQAGLPPLDFSGWSGKGVPNYIAAIHAAVGSNYEPMVGMFSEVIRRSYDRFGSRGR